MELEVRSWKKKTERLYCHPEERSDVREAAHGCAVCRAKGRNPDLQAENKLKTPDFVKWCPFAFPHSSVLSAVVKNWRQYLRIGRARAHTN